ncbi:hypothetical protein [Mycobacterium parmense]|uniref:Uncharacterized protein n=1 Tax=Mycobacterium parmense TaxID=185642 RepID=A0A7I7YVS4_9MYCO|nr:hypothetical protein [Mycobacterium parmense]MCV7350657.1 hypothetical protein [Mycobacterium parmense]ORW48358.1 hypothetical protein AWC20_25845 [Mycobacterium parmense]BBZ45916.1 hypothetical protein MPRM_31970 [Mycobacterium parmense]
MPDDDRPRNDISLVELEALLFPGGRYSLKDYGRLRATIVELSEQYGHERIMAMIKELNSIKRVPAKIAAEDAQEAFRRMFKALRDRRGRGEPPA